MAETVRDTFSHLLHCSGYVGGGAGDAVFTPLFSFLAVALSRRKLPFFSATSLALFARSDLGTANSPPIKLQVR